MNAWNELAMNSRDLAGFLTTIRGRKVFGKRGMAGNLKKQCLESFCT